MTLNTMLAAIYEPGNNDLVLKEYPIPTPFKKQVLLKVTASAVCHSDVFFLSGSFPLSNPVILGHEIVGIPVQLGPDVTGIEEGHLYAVWVIDPCAAKAAGVAPIIDSTGIGMNGGYAEYVLVEDSQLVPVPHGLKPEIAALAADSLLTVYNAVHNVAGLRPRSDLKVLIIGIGGLGHQAVQLCKHYGATVYACDYKPAARQLALELGATKAFDLAELTDATTTKKLTVDIVFDFVATSQTFTLAKAATQADSNTLGKHGKIVVVGVSEETMTFTSIELILADVYVLPTLYGSKDDVKSSLKLLADGAVRPVVQVEPLENVNKIINELRANQVTGRKVIMPGLKI
ncbi:GroES-like protein [Gloeophyllum trabeum ATCC 11539]|uniref:GroES-like protein n=1 Tax=Gloeophyllum trabeum (strain ATCC 11539 / FP-39264 / Madison 617) TaxID=670483 RepID=S7RU62_GLOTA|nr:GroES-like protein [Gloeophyllum trabeum ATCC 11539]EPQ56714.1 GroES-like protein [Gloeophyllum trabeum ATCC 11539]